MLACLAACCISILCWCHRAKFQHSVSAFSTALSCSRPDVIFARNCSQQPLEASPWTCRIMLWRSAAVLLALGSVIAQYPLEQGIVPNDQYTAAPAAAPLGAEGWRTGRSTFFDGSDTFKNAYIARYTPMSALSAVPSSPCAQHVYIGPHGDTPCYHTV